MANEYVTGNFVIRYQYRAIHNLIPAILKLLFPN